MKICFFAVGILEQGGGLEKYFIDVASHLADEDSLEVSIVTMDDELEKKLLRLLGIFYMRKIDLSTMYKIDTASIARHLRHAKYIKMSSFKALKEQLQQYDIIYSKNELLEASVLRIIVGYKNIPPVIFGCHTPINYPKSYSLQSKLHNLLYTSFIYRLLARDVSAFHVLNSSDEYYVNKYFDKVKIFKIVNPFSITKFNANAKVYKFKYKFDKNKLNILWVGRMSLQKGVHDLTKIIGLVNKELGVDKIDWNILGDGSESARFQNETKHWDNVHCLGRVDNKYIANIFSYNQLYINTSHWEGFPYTILEAKAAGVPTFAYDIPGCRDMIIDQANGILMQSIDDFRDAIVATSQKGIEFKTLPTSDPEQTSAKLYGAVKKMFSEMARY
jgi:glycosyltransferase involved in cell wall biosynthesis